MKKENSIFTKNDSLALKGIAILMMLFHHLFLDTSRYGRYNVIFYPLPENITVYIAAFFKVCVGIYVFISGYGFALKFKREKLDKKYINKFILTRYLSLFMDFFIIFLIGTMLNYFINGIFLETYRSNNIYNSISYFITDAFGLAKLFGTPTLNSTWWYMSFAYAIIALSPIVYLVYKKIGILPIMIIHVFVVHALAVNNYEMTKWVFILFLSIWFADQNVMKKIKDIGKNKIIKFIVFTLILFIFFVFKSKMNRAFLEFREGILPLFVICYLHEFIISNKYISKLFQYFGKHSTNIFLIHTFFQETFCGEFIYSFKYPFLIFFALLFCSLIASYILELLKKIINYEKIKMKLETCLIK